MECVCALFSRHCVFYVQLRIIAVFRTTPMAQLRLLSSAKINRCFCLVRSEAERYILLPKREWTAEIESEEVQVISSWSPPRLSTSWSLETPQRRVRDITAFAPGRELHSRHRSQVIKLEEEVEQIHLLTIKELIAENVPDTICEEYGLYECETWAVGEPELSRQEALECWNTKETWISNGLIY